MATDGEIIIPDYHGASTVGVDTAYDGVEDYLIDVDQWGSLGRNFSPILIDNLLPIPLDYFRRTAPYDVMFYSERPPLQFDPHRVLSLPIARTWGLSSEHWSASPTSDIMQFILEGMRPRKPLKGGVIGGHPEFLVFLSDSNRRGEPGRLYLLRVSFSS